MLKKHRRRVSVILLILWLTFLGTGIALAYRPLPTDSGGNLNIPVQKEYDTDILAAGRKVINNGLIKGDFMAAGAYIANNGQVSGDLLAAGESIDVAGDIAGDVRVAGRVIEVMGNVGHNVNMFAGEAVIFKGATIKGNALLAAGDIQIDGKVAGDILGTGEHIVINGEVLGDIRLEVNRLIIGKDAMIHGNIIYTSAQKGEISPDAQIKGKIAHRMPSPEEMKEDGKPVISWGKMGFSVTAAFLIGSILVGLFPIQMVALEQQMRETPWKVFGTGILSFVVIPVVIVIAFVTIVGIPLGIILALLYGMILYLGKIFVAFHLGQIILRKKGKKRILSLLVGLVILTIVYQIPYLKILVWFIVAFWSMGTLIYYLGSYIAEKYRRQEA